MTAQVDQAAPPPPVLTPAQCRMARAALRMSTHGLAAASAISYKTIARLEGGGRVSDKTRMTLRTALERAGVRFSIRGDWSGVEAPP